MSPRLPLVLTSALLLGACVPPAGQGTVAPAAAPTRAAQIAKVDVLTRTLSLEKNAGLKRASASMQRLFQALSRLAAPTSGAVMAGGGAYVLTGTQPQGDATYTYDDATKELTGVRTADTEVAFKFTNGGRRRTWDVTLLRSPDGTTGTFSIGIDGEWAAAPALPAWTPPSPPPYKVFGGEMPSTVDKLTFKLELQIPGGGGTVTLGGTLDEPQAMPGLPLKVPAHWQLQVAAPDVRIDWDSRLDLAAGQARFNVAGKLVAGPATAAETFTYKADYDQATQQTRGSLTHPAAGVEIRADGQVEQGMPVAGLYATDTGERLGTVDTANGRPGYLTLTMNDGQKLEWEVFPSGMTAAPFALPGFGGPPPMMAPMPEPSPTP